MIDYLIVGFGLAGSALCEVLESRGKSFTVIDDGQKSASRIAAGIYNPVVLKRLNRVWNAPTFLREAIEHYVTLQAKLGQPIISEIPLLRRFGSILEQNNWFEAADRKELSPFLSNSILPDQIEGMRAPYGYGQVYKSGRVDTSILLNAHREALVKKNCFINATFSPDDLSYEENGICYKEIKGRRIIYTLGIRALDIDMFKSLPLIASKGDYLLVEMHEFKSEQLINAGIFLIPEGNGLYTVGATYENNDHWEPSMKAREEIIEKLNKLQMPYRIVSQTSGVRPTVPDRKPLVGVLPEYPSSYLINGLGSRGVLMAPSMAMALIKYIEDGIPLWPEIDLARFSKRH